MAAFLRTFFAVILAILFLGSIPLVIALAIALAPSDPVDDDSWLAIELHGGLPEYYPPLTLQSLFDEKPTCLMAITENLEKAAADDRITGVVFRLEGFRTGTAKIDEIRAGIRRVRREGKPVYAYSPFLTDAGIYLASECDSLFVDPKGYTFFLGRGATIPHVKGVLEKLDINEQMHSVGDYKSLIELFTADESSPETLENLAWIVTEVDSAFDAVLGENLDLSAEELTALRRQASFAPRDAVDLGLADAALYWDEVEELLSGGLGEPELVRSPEYAEVSRGDVGLEGRPRVAVIHAQGFVGWGGDDRYDSVLGLVMGIDRVVDDIAAARDDDGVEAILLRIDSGGGALTGANRLQRAVERARAEKPVVVSIADVAASGGYMMSFPADHIVCLANGITGSIGVVSGKFNLRGFWEKLGLTYDDVQFAPNATLFSELHDYTDEQWEIVTARSRQVYDEWIEDIADARGMSSDEVHAVGGGRVWTGRQALECGLVDDLGGFRRALAVARDLAELEADAPVTLVHYPEEKSILDVLLSGEIGEMAAAALARQAFGGLQDLGREAELGLLYEPLRLN